MNQFNALLPQLLANETKIREATYYQLPTKASKSILAKLSGTEDTTNQPKLLALNRDSEVK